MSAGRALLGAAVLAALTLAGCQGQVNVPTSAVRGSGQVSTESRQVHGFHSVDLAGVATMTVKRGSTEALTVQAEDNLLPLLRTDVEGGVLRIGPRQGTAVAPTKPIHYDLTASQLDALHVTGAATVDARDMNADQFRLEVTGASHVDLTNLATSSLTVDVTGAGAVKASGQATRQTVTISGAGSYSAQDLSSQQATVEVSGSGDCAMRVSNSLSVSISGAGHVGYVGSPTVQQKISGLGSVTKTG